MITTVLDFNYDVSSLGAYIIDALSSLGSLWLIPAGLIIGSAILIFSFRLINQMKDKINCEGERQEQANSLKERMNKIKRKQKEEHRKVKKGIAEGKQAHNTFRKMIEGRRKSDYDNYGTEISGRNWYRRKRLAMFSQSLAEMRGNKKQEKMGEFLKWFRDNPDKMGSF